MHPCTISSVTTRQAYARCTARTWLRRSLNRYPRVSRREAGNAMRSAHPNHLNPPSLSHGAERVAPSPLPRSRWRSLYVRGARGSCRQWSLLFPLGVMVKGNRHTPIPRGLLQLYRAPTASLNLLLPGSFQKLTFARLRETLLLTPYPGPQLPQAEHIYRGLFCHTFLFFTSTASSTIDNSIDTQHGHDTQPNQQAVRWLRWTLYS